MSLFWRWLKSATDEVREGREHGSQVDALGGIVWHLFVALCVVCEVAAVSYATVALAVTSTGWFLVAAVSLAALLPAAWVLWSLSEPDNENAQKS